MMANTIFDAKINGEILTVDQQRYKHQITAASKDFKISTGHQQAVFG